LVREAAFATGPLKHGGTTAPENLAWSCFDCNIFKEPNVAGIDPESGVVERLFNPRSDAWTEYFRWDGPRLVGQTPTGPVTVEVLRINLPSRLEHRRMLIACQAFD